MATFARTHRSLRHPSHVVLCAVRRSAHRRAWSGDGHYELGSIDDIPRSDEAIDERSDEGGAD
jgi:hypothetical protein